MHNKKIFCSYTYGKPVIGKLNLNLSLESYSYSYNYDKIPVLQESVTVSIQINLCSIFKFIWSFFLNATIINVNELPFMILIMYKVLLIKQLSYQLLDLSAGIASNVIEWELFILFLHLPLNLFNNIMFPF